MTKRDILSIAFKIIGIYSVMNVIASFPAIFMPMVINLQKSSIMELDIISKWYLVISISFSILMFIFAYILLRWSDLIAEKLIKTDTTFTPLSTSYNEKSIFILSLRIIGSLQIVQAIPKITVTLVQYLDLAVKKINVQSYIFSHYGLNMIVGIIQLFIGAYLISGGKYLVQFAFREWINTTEKNECLRN